MTTSILITILALACLGGLAFFFKSGPSGHLASVRNWLSSQGEGVDRLFSLAHSRFFFVPVRLCLTEDEFQKKVLDSVEGTKKDVGEQGEKLSAIEKQNAELTGNFENLQKETKQAFEDLTKAKNELNSLSDITKSLRRVQAQMGNERRMAFGDPIRRILASEENKARLNCAFRAAVNTDGKFRGQIEAIGKALGEDSSPGSTMIDDALASEIYDALAMYGSWNTLAVRNLGTKTTKFPVKTARPIANFVLTEGGTIADDTNKAGTSVSLEVELIAVLLNVSMQLLEDSEFDVASDVLRDFVEAYAYRLDYAAFVADGTSTGTAAKLHGGQTGLFEFGTAVTADTGDTTIEGLEFEDVTKCLYSNDLAGIMARRLQWWMSPTNLVRMMSIKDDNGRPIFLTATEAPAPGALGSILGYPVNLVNVAPTANTAGSKVAAFGDPEAFVVGIRRDFNFAASDHHRWDEFQRSFRGVGRAGVKGRDAGAINILTLGAAST